MSKLGGGASRSPPQPSVGQGDAFTPGQSGPSHRCIEGEKSLRRLSTALVTLGVAASFGAVYAAPGSAEPAPPVTAADRAAKAHELPNPLEDKRRALREEAITSVVNGEAKPVTKNGSEVVKVGRSYAPADAAALRTKAGRKALAAAKGQKAQKQDQYVELSQERADKVFVILAEFGDQRHPSYPDDGWVAYEMCSPLAGGGSEENLDRCARRFVSWMTERGFAPR